MTREPAEPPRLDYLIKAGAIHSMTGATYRSVGLRGPEIVAVSAEPDGLDDLAGGGTAVTDAGDLTVLPAFADAHEHLMEASRNTLLVPVDKARSVAEFTGMVTDAARAAPPGGWILTSIGWHESNLAENRLPTLAELDAAAPDHPVLARRGGHLAVVNSAALRAAGIGADTPDPPGGKIGRLADGGRDGVLEGGAVYRSRRSRRGRAGRSWPTRWGRLGRLRGAGGGHHPRGDDQPRRAARLPGCRAPRAAERAGPADDQGGQRADDG
jgi:predicted amidohydrolase YtcJ